MTALLPCVLKNAISPEIIASDLEVNKETAESMISGLIEKELIFNYNPSKKVNLLISYQKFEKTYSSIDSNLKNEIEKEFCFFNEKLDISSGKILPDKQLEEELKERALRLLKTQKQINASILQKHLQIGYSNACKLLEWLQKHKLIETQPVFCNTETLYFSYKIKTGFNELDKNLNIEKSDLVVIGGLNNSGKSYFLCSIIENNLNTYISLFFSMDLLKSYRLELLEERAKEKEKNFYLIKDIIDLNTLIISISEHKLKYGIDVVYIDNFKNLLICSNCSEEELIKKLKYLAEKLDIAIIVTDLVNYRNYPTYADLSHKQFIKYADKIVIIHAPYPASIIDENRENPSIRIEKCNALYLPKKFLLEFDKETLTFSEKTNNNKNIQCD